MKIKCSLLLGVLIVCSTDAAMAQAIPGVVTQDPNCSLQEVVKDRSARSLTSGTPATEFVVSCNSSGNCPDLVHPNTPTECTAREGEKECKKRANEQLLKDYPLKEELQCETPVGKCEFKDRFMKMQGVCAYKDPWESKIDCEEQNGKLTCTASVVCKYKCQNAKPPKGANLSEDSLSEKLS
jgi:hypothetical protein